MQNILEMQSKISIDSNSYQGTVVESIIEALKSLAILLLREVESLGNSSNGVGNKKGEIILSDELVKIEIDFIRDALLRAKGNQRRAAKLLGTKVTTLNAKIKRYEIESAKILGRF